MSADTPPTGVPMTGEGMTGEEAISNAQEVIAWHDEKSRKRREDFNDHMCGTVELPDHLDTHGMMAAAIRALLTLARTGLLVERTMAIPHFGASVSFVKCNRDGERVFVVNRFPSEGAVEGPTLTAAVEAALKGQQ